MSKKVALCLTIFVFLFAGMAFSAKQHRINHLGNPGTAFYRPPLKSVADLQKMAKAKKADIQAVLEMRGWKGNIDDLMTAVDSGKIDDTTIAKGAELPFMANRGRHGKPGVIENVVWISSRPFAAYHLEFDSNGYTYNFYFPKACGNFWMEEKPSTKKTEPVVVPTLSVSAGDVCVTQGVHAAITVSNAPADAQIQFTLDGQTQQMPASSGTKDLPGYNEPGSHTITIALQGASPATATFNVKPCPPVCAVTTNPVEVLHKKPFMVDASGSHVADGVTVGLKSASVELSREGKIVQTFDLAAPNLKSSEMKVNKSGSYTIKSTVTDEVGQKTTCEATVVVPVPTSPWFVGGFFGKERLVQDDEDYQGGRCAPLVGFKFGAVPKIAKDLELELSVGGKINTRDSNNSSMFADIALNKIVGKGFFGGGVSFWDLTESDTRAAALLIQGGFDLDVDRQWQLVLEARGPFDQFDDLSNNYQFWAGIRFYPGR